jgi:Zn-dependent peptidase ImmA (M78 family)
MRLPPREPGANVRVLPIAPSKELRRRTANGDVVTTWQQAHRLANIAAAKAHHDLGIDTSALPIDVDTAIYRAGVVLMWRPLPRLFGMYINEPASQPGIIVNTRLPHGARRHTAAHELGHHRLNHSTSVEDGSTMELSLHEGEEDAPTVRRRTGWPGQEKVAEAFASWFLMPRRAVLAGLAWLGTDHPKNAMDVYRLSLLLGTSYRSTVRHLLNLHQIPQTAVPALMQTPPGRLKAELDRTVEPPPSRSPDVWLIDHGFAGATLQLRAGDRLVIDVPTRHELDHPAWLTVVPRRPAASTSNVVALECEGHQTSFGANVFAVRDRASGELLWQVNLIHAEPPLGLDPRWVHRLPSA